MPLDPKLAVSISEHIKADWKEPDSVAQLVGGAQSQGPGTGQAAAPASSEGGQADDSPEDKATAGAEGQGIEPQATADVPESYFGVDLSDLEPEVRGRIITDLKERDKYFQSVQRKNAELQKQLASKESPAGDRPAPVAQQAEPPSDDDILSLLGYNKDDAMYDVKAEVALPLAKQVISLQKTVESLVATQQVEQELVRWNTTLDRMEKEYGPLPDDISREDVVEFAIEHNVFDPEDAYLRIAAGARRFINDEATKARQAALKTLKEQAAGGIRPRTDAPVNEAPIKAKTSREGIRLAAAAAEKELGYTWGDAIKAEPPA